MFRFYLHQNKCVQIYGFRRSSPAPYGGTLILRCDCPRQSFISSHKGAPGEGIFTHAFRFAADDVCGNDTELPTQWCCDTHQPITHCLRRLAAYRPPTVMDLTRIMG